ncbi:hypothetical protein CK203_101711 [Vitis vinifera]|uniref:Retrotransposon gag domain-containing protein n=1 Tax=Vitis vinifera TaxID=29760 RepID=A0A438DQM2_VITVI|nr:hypothetical protein CK203_101711 [Vitis vinifera]
MLDPHKTISYHVRAIGSGSREVVACVCLIGFGPKGKTSKDRESLRHRVGCLCKHHGPSTRGSEFSHGQGDNPNAYLSMRDRMHPPRMSAPSCIEFEEVWNTFREGGASIDLMRLKLFPFTLKDKAKIWLYSLRPRSIRNWVDLQAEFLKKFFPTHRTNGLKREISNFSAKENEKFYECWERYMEAINACPHHGFDTWLLVSYFYDGMSSSMKQILETMCGGDFMSKNPEEAMDFLSYVSEVSRGWDEPNSREMGKDESSCKSKGWNVHVRLTNLNTLNEKGKFPSQPSQNPKGVHEVETQDEESSKLREVKTVITLRSGKEVDQPLPKDLCTVKRGLHVTKKAFLTEQVSAIIQSKSPVKYKDPGCPTISVNIGGTHVEKALLDLGASVNLLPYSVYKQLGLGGLKPTTITLSLADRSVKIPRG